MWINQDNHQRDLWHREMCPHCEHLPVCQELDPPRAALISCNNYKGWIPIKFRPMTDEEVQEREEFLGSKLEPDERYMLACPLPDDGQEILVSTKWGVSMDTCYYDPDYGYCLEDRGDWDDVTAWMPVPEKYEEA